MKANIRTAALLCCLVLLAAALGAPAQAAQGTYLMQGKISAIDSAYDTVVVEVPLGARMFTVGGPLAPGAALTRHGRPAALEDFRIGETVQVKWRATPNGHVIEKLAAR